MRNRLGFIIFLSIVLLSCSGSDDGPQSPPPTLPAPSSATLIFPEEDSECTAGDQVSATESSITFRWNTSENTDEYRLTVRSLNTGVASNFETESTSFTVTLNKGEGYSWSVESSSTEASQDAQSETWRFYNAGDGIESYAPFPASIIAPLSGSKIPDGNINLSWSGSDVDNDIVGYDIYLDEVNPPTTIIESDFIQESVATSPLTAGVYYWKVVSKDVLGNTSESIVSEFRIE